MKWQSLHEILECIGQMIEVLSRDPDFSSPIN